MKLPFGWPLEVSLDLFQAAITFAISGLYLVLAVTYRKRYFGVWAAAWGLYVARLCAIALFMMSRNHHWLFVHQVATGWTSLLLLWAAVVFAWQPRWRHWYHVFIALPVVWAWVAIYRVRDFLFAAVPSVIFLSVVTLVTGVVFGVYGHRARSRWAAVVSAAFFLWGLHHLDYPFLRASGAWVPYGYYLDILFVLAVAGGMLMLVIEDQHRGIAALAALAGDLQRSLRPADVLHAVLERPLALPAVVGCALFRPDTPEGEPVFRGGSGVCAGESTSLDDVRARHPHALFLPISVGERPAGTFVIVSRIRDPFAALDHDFHVTLGQQIGAALQHSEIYAALEERSAELGRASASLLRAEEAERRRIARELHDETGQVLTAIRLELGLLARQVEGNAPAREALDRALSLTGRALETIRATVRGLRPAALDDLGLVPAVESLAEEFSGRTGIVVDCDAKPDGDLPPEVEVALYRIFQEALTNVARHAEAKHVRAALRRDGDAVVLVVQDDGHGFDPSKVVKAGDSRAGLAGMRERLVGLGGRLEVTSAPGQGVRLEARMPLEATHDQ
ncbi:MAG: histidine kinase [Gemmatimonadota bacterium]